MGNRKFANAAECRTFFRDILRRYKDGDVISANDTEFVRDLLQKYRPG